MLILKKMEKIEFTQSLVGQKNRVFVPSVEKGVKTACSDGIFGFRYKDDFYDGKMHPVDSIHKWTFNSYLQILVY